MSINSFIAARARTLRVATHRPVGGANRNVTTRHRTPTVRTVAASMLAVAALTLTTACSGESGTGTKAEGKADSASGEEHGSQADALGGGATKQQAGAENAARTVGSEGAKTEPIGNCDINKTVFNLQDVQRPVNHMLLSATNGAGVDCKLVGFPRLKFGADAQAATPVIEESKPQSVIVLAPGESAYAGITTSSADGSGEHGREVNSLEVFIEGSEDGTNVELPGGSVYVDSGARVTYWQDNVDDALAW
ncbi:DUF4232 domain-containing protein [Streptomyces sp. Rer75]|uniref:DUF4232 domain-containing protein n=1 Tax=Streptomyces sp. Rer75 TaxID=2750011 RepID=UPI0015D07B19|nr:DUF4232 domain-containing protein [Streptomyces sp. Rer75]QLH25381.1 DUF4232 domain-containing protein [Streptomyces sp. Rer75]